MSAKNNSDEQNTIESTFNNVLSEHSFEQIIQGSPMIIKDMDESGQKEAILCAISCYINGPVGVGKLSRFPCVDGEFKIREKFNVTAAPWRSFCKSLHYLLPKKLPCLQIKSHGDYWPTDNEMISQ
eukprot:469953_1